jgi:glycosyltransferase involved in cell wall biosynthesis
MLNFREATILFVGPDPGIGVSGGNIFNQRLFKSLTELGVSLASLDDWPEVLPKKLKHLIIDSLYLDSIDRLEEISGWTRPHKWLLLHHLNSMFPPAGISSDEYFYENEKDLLDKFDKFIVTSNFSKAYLEKRGIDPADIRVLIPCPPSGIKVSTKEHEVPRILILGNLIRRKGLVPFLGALADIEVKPRFELVMFGRDDIEPDYARACIDQINRLPGMRYAGVVPPIGTINLWQEFDMLISPAYMETFGMSLQEAKYAGLVRMAVDGGFARHHLQTGAEDLIAHGPAELAEKFVALLRNPIRLSKYRKEAIKEAKALPEPDKAWLDQIKKFKAEL